MRRKEISGTSLRRIKFHKGVSLIMSIEQNKKMNHFHNFVY